MTHEAIVERLTKLHTELGDLIAELVPGQVEESPVPITTSDAGIALIKRFEGLRLSAYRDSGDVPTIGYGHIEGVRMGTTITEEKAEQLLRGDIGRAEDAVHAAVTVPLSQHQFDALVSLTYNIGAGALRKSTLLRLLNEGDYAGAAKQFERWKYDDGKVLQGLVRRRADEKDLFLS